MPEPAPSPPTESEGEKESRPGEDAWISQTKGVERVISVILATSESRQASWVADEAHVSEKTARDYLKLLTEQLGILKATTVQGVTKYEPDAAYLRFRQVSRILEEHDSESLTEEAVSLQERIEECEKEHEAESPGELRTLAAKESTSAEEARYYREVSSEWDSLRHQLSVIEDALARCESDRDERITQPA